MSAFLSGLTKGLLICAAVAGCEVRDNLAVRRDQILDAGSAEVDGAGFPSDLRLRGTALYDLNSLVLTTGAKNERGSAFSPLPFALSATARFEVSMRFRITPTPGIAGPADGIALVWHNDRRGLAADGQAGGGLGYRGINPAVVVEFDTHKESATDPNANHIALVNGKAEVVAQTADVPVDLSGDDVFAWITHDASRGMMQVYVSQADQKPIEPVLTAAVQLSTTLGAQAFLGVTASTGQRVARQVVTNFSVMYRP